MQILLKNLADLLGKENLFTDPADLASCSFVPWYGEATERPMPIAVARPVNVTQLADTLRLCSEAGMPMRVRGAATAPGKESDRREIIILTTGLGRILDLDADNRRALLQCGVSCGRLNEEAAKAGLFFPPDPVPPGLATIGGAIAENAVSPRSLKYGPVGNYVRKLELCMANGDCISFFSQNNAPGNLENFLLPASFLCGSRGSLGVIATAEVTLLPLSGPARAIVAGFSSLAAGAKAASAILAAGLTPSAMELVDQDCAPLLGWSGATIKNILFIEFDSADQAAVMEETRRVLGANGADSISMPKAENDEINQFWRKLHGLLPALRAKDGPFYLETLACPPSLAATLIDNIRQLAANAGLRHRIFGSPGIARFQIALSGGNPETVRATAQALFIRELMLNKRLQSENELESAREEWLSRREELARVSRGIRGIFDPKGLLGD